jgi:hypothetical protein
MLANNAGFNCICARVVVTAANWPQRAAFLQEVERALAALPLRHAYYPGAESRHAAFIEAHPDAAQLGERREGALPWTFVRGCDPVDASDACFTTEAFCSLMGETALPGDTPGEFLERATEFCNETLWGTLGATLIVKDQRAGDVAPAMDRAVRDLRYGSICVNAWVGMAFGTTVNSWGAYPGHTDADIQSGRGVVGNTYMLRDPEKSVVRSPFRFRPAPAWFSGHKNGERAMRALSAMEAHPSPATLAKLFAAAMRP